MGAHAADPADVGLGVRSGAGDRGPPHRLGARRCRWRPPPSAALPLRVGRAARGAALGPGRAGCLHVRAGRDGAALLVLLRSGPGPQPGPGGGAARARDPRRVPARPPPPGAAHERHPGHGAGLPLRARGVPGRTGRRRRRPGGHQRDRGRRRVGRAGHAGDGAQRRGHRTGRSGAALPAALRDGPRPRRPGRAAGRRLRLDAAEHRRHPLPPASHRLRACPGGRRPGPEGSVRRPTGAGPRPGPTTSGSRRNGCAGPSWRTCRRWSWAPRR
jgi:hypothetical protein